MTTITVERSLLEQALDALSAPNHRVFSESPICVGIRAALAAPATAPGISIGTAVKKLRESLRNDLGYAWSWHCNIAMTAFDAGCPHDVANEGAARFMELLAGVDTREHPGFRGTQEHPMQNVATASEQRVKELEAENERLKDDYHHACKLVADMHAAAVGEVVGPKIGVVEDVAAVRTENERLCTESEELLQNCAALVAENEQLRKDAERYQYLRKASIEMRNRAEHYCESALDVFIDAAMKGEKP